MLACPVGKWNTCLGYEQINSRESIGRSIGTRGTEVESRKIEESKSDGARRSGKHELI